MRKHSFITFLLLLSVITFLFPVHANASYTFIDQNGNIIDRRSVTAGIIDLEDAQVIDNSLAAARKYIPDSLVFNRMLVNQNTGITKYYFADKEGSKANIQYRVDVNYKTDEVLAVSMVGNENRSSKYAVSAKTAKKSVKSAVPKAVVKTVRRAKPKWNNGSKRDYIYVATFSLQKYEGKAYIKGDTGTVYKYSYKKK